MLVVVGVGVVSTVGASVVAGGGGGVGRGRGGVGRGRGGVGRGRGRPKHAIDPLNQLYIKWITVEIGNKVYSCRI